MVGFVWVCIRFHRRLRSGRFAAPGTASRSTPFQAGVLPPAALSANQPPPDSVRQSEPAAVSEPEELRELAAASGSVGILFGVRAAGKNPAGTDLRRRRNCGWGFEHLAGRHVLHISLLGYCPFPLLHMSLDHISLDLFIIAHETSCFVRSFNQRILDGGYL